MTRQPEGEIAAGIGLDPAVRFDSQEPGTASERYLAALWSEIIGLPQVMRGARFLDVGGNSLTLNLILNRIEQDTGVSLDPQQFFDDERSSLFELARALDVLLEEKV